MSRIRGAALPAMLLAMAVLLGACSATRPAVTMSADGTEVTVPAAAWCEDPRDPGTCTAEPESTSEPHLALPPGARLEVSVPESVAAAPWAVVFSYRDPGGATQGARSPIFSPGTRQSWVLQPPAGAQLTRVEVQNLTTNGVNFPAFRTWVLLVDPAAG